MVDEFKCELYLNADLIAILNTVRSWLHSNGFKFKERVNGDNAFINSRKGGFFSGVESEMRRWLEIRVSQLPTSNYIVLYERISENVGHHMKSDIIKDEVLALAAFLQSGGIPLQPQSQHQQQQIVVNVATPQVAQPVPQTQDTPIFCIQCGTRNQANAVFCKNCGATIER